LNKATLQAEISNCSTFRFLCLRLPGIDEELVWWRTCYRTKHGRKVQWWFHSQTRLLAPFL